MLLALTVLIALGLSLIFLDKSQGDRSSSNAKKPKTPRLVTRSSGVQSRPIRWELCAGGGSVMSKPWRSTSAASETRCAHCQWNVSEKDAAQLRLITRVPARS